MNSQDTFAQLATNDDVFGFSGIPADRHRELAQLADIGVNGLPGARRPRYSTAWRSASVRSTRSSAATRSSSARSAWRSTTRGTIIWMRIV